jgi:hypothetical protein
MSKERYIESRQPETGIDAMCFLSIAQQEIPPAGGCVMAMCVADWATRSDQVSLDR